ncbi:MAG: TetR/AcrR family transcriptional regulator [Acidimicrobiales bacterium]
MTATDTQEQILDAVLSVIVRNGVQGLTFRAVAAEADVALGSLNYHFDDKEALIAAAFRRAAENVIDATEGSVAHIDDPDEAVRAFIRGVLSAEFLNEDYLALRLSLWAVGRFAPDISAINAEIHARYRDELGRLITRARPELSRDQALDRVTDLMMVQFGLWVTWTWQPDPRALERCLTRCEQIALGELADFEQ